MASFSSNLDLNLFKAFVVTYQERNLKRAANLLSCTAPAVSIKLSKLRDHFDQTLFIKVPSGLEPTPFADELFLNVEPLLNTLESKVTHIGGFKPERVKGTINMAVSRHLLPWLAPRLFRGLQEQAPDSSLMVNLFGIDSIERIKRGEIDIGIEYRQSITKELSEITLGSHSLRFVVRKGHPFSKDKASLKDLARYDFALLNNAMEPGHPGLPIFRDMKQQSTPIRIKFSSLSYAATFDVVTSSDLVCPVPKNLYIKHKDKLRSIEVTDVNAHKEIPVYGYIHQKNRYSEKHLWLMGLISKELSEQKGSAT